MFTLWIIILIISAQVFVWYVVNAVYCNGPNITAVVELIRGWSLFVQLLSAEEHNLEQGDQLSLIGTVNSSDVTNTCRTMWSEVRCSFVDLNFALGDWADGIYVCVCVCVFGCPIWICSYYWKIWGGGGRVHTGDEEHRSFNGLDSEPNKKTEQLPIHTCCVTLWCVQGLLPEGTSAQSFNNFK